MEKGTDEVKLTSKKANKVAKSKLEKKNLDNAKAKITKEKDLLYIYPKGATDLATRKTFRHGVRRQLASFQKQIKKAEKGEKSTVIAEATKWAAGVYAPEHMPKF